MFFKNKFMLIFSLMILVIISIGSVSAMDINDTDVSISESDFNNFNDDVVLCENVGGSDQLNHYNASGNNDYDDVIGYSYDDILDATACKISLNVNGQTGSITLLKNVYYTFDYSIDTTPDKGYVKPVIDGSRDDSFGQLPFTGSFRYSFNALGSHTVLMRAYSVSSLLGTSYDVSCNTLNINVVDEVKNYTTLTLSSRDYSGSTIYVPHGDKLYFDVVSNPPITNDGAYYKVIFSGSESDNNFVFDDDGIGSFAWTPSTKTNYTLSVKSYNSSDYYDASSNSIKVCVLEKPRISLEANATDVQYDEKIRFVHSVIDSNGDKITSGMVSYYIDGEFRINVSANQALQLKMNIPGKHNISVKYCGNNKYAFSNFAYVIITVGQIDPELNVTINDVNYPNKPVVNIKTNAKGNYTVKVANYVNEIVEVTGDEVNLTLNNLGVGDYVAEINFNGSEKFNPISMNVSFSILRKDAGFRLNSSIKNNDEIAYGSTITFVAFINDTQAEGSVDFYLDGVYNVTSNLLENVSFSSLDYGQHIITANYSGGDEFMDDSKSISFVVIDGRQDIDFVVYADPENAEIIYGDDLTLTPFALVFTSIEGNVDFYVDGVYNVTSNLMEDVILSNLAVGSHTIVAKYSGDSNYKNASYTLECNVLDSKADPEFDFITNIDNNSIEYGTILEINATAGFDVTGSIDYYVDDVYTATSNALSQSTFESVSFSNLDYGEHTIVACYSGDDNYLNKNYTFTFTVTGNLTDVKIELLIDGSKKTVVRINKTEFLNFSNIVTPYPGNVKIRLYNNGSDSGINGWYANSWLSKPFYDEGIYYYTAVFEGNDDYARAVSNQVMIIVGNPKIINTTSMALKCSPALNPQSVTYHVGEELGITSTILKGDGTGVLGIGNITFYDNGEFLQFIDLETSGSIIPIIYVTYDKAGMHNVSAYFSGNENYTSCNSWIQFEVERNDIDISINVNNVTYPSKVLANVTVTAPGNYSVIIHNKTYSIEFFDGETSKLVECDQILDAKTDYVVKVLFNQTDYYNSVNVSTIFEVLKNDSAEFNIFAESVSIQQGDSIKITSNLDNAYGDVIYSEGDKQLGNAPINNVFTYNKLTPGYHKIIANYTGDKNHISVLRDISIFVNESHIMLNTTLNLKADKNDVVIGNAVIITSQVVDSNNDIVNEGNVTFYDENGEILGVNTLELNPTKNMTVIARYDGTNKYNPSESSISINVILNNASFKIVVSDVTLPDSPVAVVTTNAYGNYIIIVGNKSYDVEFKHGESLKEIALDNLVEGNYSAKLIYLGNDVYNSGEESADFVVEKSVISGFVVYVTPLTSVYGSTITLTSAFGVGDAEGNVTYSEGENVLGTTKIGESLKLSNLTAGYHNILAIYSGDNNYDSDVSTVAFTVLKSNVTLSIVSSDVIYPNRATVNVTSNVDGKFILNVANQKINVNTVNGFASIQLPVLSGGKYDVVVIFKGNDNYNSFNNTTSFNVLPAKNNFSIESDSYNITYGESIILTPVLPFDAKGNITFTDDNSNVLGVISTDETLEIDSLNAGNITIIGFYSGDGNYNAEKAEINVLVNPASINLDLSVFNVTYPEKTNVQLMSSVDAVYSVKIGDKTYNISVKNGEGNIDLYLDSGSYMAVVDVTMDNYNPLSINKEFKVDRQDSVLMISGLKDKIEFNETLHLESNLDNTVFIFDDGSNITAKSADYTPKTSGNHSIVIMYPGDKNHSPINQTYVVNVLDEPSFVIEALDVEKYYGGSERFVVSIKDNNNNGINNQSVKININGVEYTRVTSNGSASIALNLNSGFYNVTVSVNDTQIISGVTIKATVNGSNVVKVFRNATQYYATFRNSHGDYLDEGTIVRFNINGVMYDRQVGVNGLAKLNINLDQGSYIITATNLNTGEMASNIITVIPRIVENYDITKYFRNATQYTVKVLGDDGNPVGEGENVTFNINGVFYTRTTNASGMAKLNINLDPGKYVITVQYGDCRVSNNIEVLPVLSADDIRMSYRDGTKFEAKLVDGKGNPISNATVEFNINGVFYHRLTDLNGIAGLNINLQSGIYIITSSYQYATASNKITIS